MLVLEPGKYLTSFHRQTKQTEAHGGEVIDSLTSISQQAALGSQLSRLSPARDLPHWTAGELTPQAVSLQPHPGHGTWKAFSNICS